MGASSKSLRERLLAQITDYKSQLDFIDIEGKKVAWIDEQTGDLMVDRNGIDERDLEEFAHWLTILNS